MKKSKIIFLIFFLMIIGIVITILIINKKYSYEDENTLYFIEFENEILRYERYDYALGQNQIVGVEISTNKGKSFKKITNTPITLSLEPKLIFLNNKLGFAISKANLTKSNNYIGVKVTQDGGKNFIDGKIHYENSDIEILTIESLPYFENEKLKMKCSIYEFNKEKDRYEDKELIFTSFDEGLNWNL